MLGGGAPREWPSWRDWGWAGPEQGLPGIAAVMVKPQPIPRLVPLFALLGGGRAEGSQERFFGEEVSEDP